MNSVELVNGGMGIKNPMLQHSRFPAQSQQLGKFEYVKFVKVWEMSFELKNAFTNFGFHGMNTKI